MRGTPRPTSQGEGSDGSAEEPNFFPISGGGRAPHNSQVDPLLPSGVPGPPGTPPPGGEQGTLLRQAKTGDLGPPVGAGGHGCLANLGVGL